MGLTVIKAGLLDSFQDRGRFGHRHQGINTGGAMDRYSLQVANILAGNDPGEAALELHFPAGAFLFTEPALLALAGADFAASINGEAVPVHHPILVGKNDVLHFHQPVHGARVYLAVRGGWALEPWLGSYSTNLRAGAGGWQGRALQKQDHIPFRQHLPVNIPVQEDEFRVLPWGADARWMESIHEIAILPGKEWEQLTVESTETLLMTDFLITRQSDRMGYQLNHIPLHRLRREEMVSTGVSAGTLQLLPDGRLIILMADHQTTGGYPRVAQVITAHLPRLAQCRAGEKIRFRMADMMEAEEALLRQQEHLLQLQNACTFRLHTLLHEGAH